MLDLFFKKETFSLWWYYRIYLMSWRMISLDVLLLNGSDIITRLLIVIDSTLFQFRIKVHKILSFHFIQFKQKNVCAEKKKILSLARRRSFYAIQKSCQVRMRNNERQHVINDRSFVCGGVLKTSSGDHATRLLYYKGKTSLPFHSRIYTQLCFFRRIIT